MPAWSRSRFLRGYYVYHVVTFIAFVLLRRRVDAGELSMPDAFGLPKEFQVYLCALLMAFARAFSAPTLDAFISYCFLFLKAACAVVLWYMGAFYLGWFAAVWALIAVLAPQPRARDPDSVAILNRASFADRITRNDAQTIWVVQIYATWSPRCVQLAPLFASLATKWSAPSRPRLRFGKVDVAQWPEVAESLRIDVSALSPALPTIVAFRAGREVARAPNAGRDCRPLGQGTTLRDIEESIGMTALVDLADTWEQAATQMSQKARARAKRR